MAEVAHTLHQRLGDLDAMDVDDLLAWHAQAARINRLTNEGLK